MLHINENMKSVGRVLSLIFACVLVDVKTATLPSFIEKCSLSDPEISNCIRVNGNKAIPNIAKGLPDLSIPSLMPLKIPFIALLKTDQITVNITDLNVNGLEKADLKDISYALDAPNFIIEFTVDELELSGKYSAKGKLMVMPVEGEGPMTLKIENGKFKAVAVNSVKIDDNGKHHVHTPKVTLDFDLEKVVFQLDNLFNGDKLLGDNVNKFLNENWQDLLKDFKAPIAEVIQDMVRDIANGFLDKLTVEELFLS